MSNKSTILLTADHNGVQLKEKVFNFLKREGYCPIDLGPYSTHESADYVDYAVQLSQIISAGSATKGVLICGTGVGMSIVANKFSEVRAALVHSTYVAPKSREHNDSNVLCLGAWVLEDDTNLEIIKLWLNEEFGGGRHVKRIEKIPKTKKGRLVFTNGVFDILHTGHIDLLRFSKSLGEYLVVAINTDAAVRKLKGPNRPINTEEDRKRVIEAIREVDEVVLFDGSLEEVREQINPDVVVKGGEWTAKEVRARDCIPDHVGIKIFPLVKDYSTTNILEKIKTIDDWKKKE